MTTKKTTEKAPPKEKRTVVCRLHVNARLKGYEGKDYESGAEVKVRPSEAVAWRNIMTCVCAHKGCSKLATRGGKCPDHQPKTKD